MHEECLDQQLGKQEALESGNTRNCAGTHQECLDQSARNTARAPQGIHEAKQLNNVKNLALYAGMWRIQEECHIEAPETHGYTRI